MGMGSNRGGGRVTMSEINVTPMVDVMLVLLIIFMVTAPLIQQGVKVNLPEAKAAPVEAAEKKLASNAKAQADKELYLHADRDVPYGVVVDVMAAAQRAGITNVGMITDPTAGGRASNKGKKDTKEARR